MKSKSSRRSAFDYTISVTRRNRYLVVSCPDLGLHASAQCLLMDQLNPAQLGVAVLRMYERVRSELDRISLQGEAQPRPQPVGALQTRPQELTAAQAAKALGLSLFIVRKLGDAGVIAQSRTPGGHRRFSVKSLSSFLLRRESPAA